MTKYLMSAARLRLRASRVYWSCVGTNEEEGGLAILIGVAEATVGDVV